MVTRDGVHHAAVDRQHHPVVPLDETLLFGERNGAYIAIQVEHDIGLLGRDVGEADRLIDAYGARQLIGAGDHGGQLVERGERGDSHPDPLFKARTNPP